MSDVLSSRSRQELIRALRRRYQEGSRVDKGRILEELVAVSGYHRKSAIRILSNKSLRDDHATGRGRRRQYDEAARQALIEALESHGHLRLEPSIRTRLTAMSAATMDRLLREVKATARGRRPPKRRSAVQRQVPIRTFTDWHEPDPGFMEIDLVAHCGTLVGGSHANTLCLTDVASGWTECVALLVRDGSLVVEAIRVVRNALRMIRLGWSRRTVPSEPLRWVPPVGRTRCSRGVEPSLCGDAAICELLPALLQTRGEGPRQLPGPEALPRSPDALPTALELADGLRADETTAPRGGSAARSIAVARRDSTDAARRRSTGAGQPDSHSSRDRRRPQRISGWPRDGVACGRGTANSRGKSKAFAALAHTSRPIRVRIIRAAPAVGRESGSDWPRAFRRAVSRPPWRVPQRTAADFAASLTAVAS